MRKPFWIRSHHRKPLRRHDIPDMARFPDLPACGYESAGLADLRALHDSLTIKPKGK